MPGWDVAHKEIARRFAPSRLTVAMLPNLHFPRGQGHARGEQRECARGRRHARRPHHGDVQAAIDYVRALPYLNGKVGVIGYCSGGRQAYLAACTLRGLDCRDRLLRRRASRRSPTS